jgi:CheY-like chemotaxis protein
VIQILTGALASADKDPVGFAMPIVLELKLSNVSGIDVLCWIRQQPRLDKLPVLILTASDDHLDLQQASQLGATSYLIKPCNDKDLVVFANTASDFRFE